jgi:hypothetical protein
VFILADTEDTAECLLFNGVVPPKVNGDTAVSPGEVKTINYQYREVRALASEKGDIPKATTFESSNQDLDILIVSKTMNNLSTVF